MSLALQKKRYLQKSKSGFIILVLTSVMLTLTFSAALVLFQGTFSEYRSAELEAGHMKARMLAQSGMEAAIMILTRVPADQLASVGFFIVPLSIPLGEGIVSIQISEESGKLNVNRLVRFIDNTMDPRVREMFDSLSTTLGLPADIWDPVVDYIDEDNIAQPRGFEQADYSRLTPPRRIKNGRLHSLEELLLIPGFDRSTIFEDIRSEKRKEDVSEDFLSDLEKLTISDDDFILANNITVYLPTDPMNPDSDRINVNTAPYHVMLSLSPYMTPDAARAIIRARFQKGGRFTSLNELASIPALSINTVGSATLYQEIESRITVNDQLYKIVAEASTDLHLAHVTSIYDMVSRKITLYLE
ncbi:MAG: general secretion pathway protein GspK [Leptospiraceae bacterium]|nr:general secretion pathway protein GspK [Leptospiraceae bacterium]